ncbi:uncharacterized protein LOC131242543 isoform X2 [Magnolia sinica]|uniref:uncharacterized protein LOC131242543 isoform X2 n=1 Tax=Magnolia sinica TaxID=86752 RepID=UPI002658158D|nr:uncharacterized protein LOC131242543 isoform X2 [Magnolia sinica]
MKMGILYFLVTLLVSLAHVNARNIFLIENAGKSMLEYGDSLHGSVVVDLTPEEEVPSLEVLPPDFICHSCLEVSRKAEEILTDPMLLEKAGEISTEVCQVLPSDLQVKAILFLQEYFCEENLCNSTGLCTGDTETPSAKGVVHQSGTQSWLLTPMHLHRFTNKISDEKTCTACHNAMDELLKELQNPETKMKVLKILLKACENVENHVKECKKMVLEYGPLALANLEKFVTNNDLCSVVHICHGAPPHADEMTDSDIPFIALPHTKYVRSIQARMVM